MKNIFFKNLLRGAIGVSTCLIASISNANVIADLHTVGIISSNSGTIPSSYSQALEEDFFFVFDSWYQDDETGLWVGGQVTLDRVLIDASCRLQLGGYFWVTGGNLYVAVVTGDPDVPPPSGTNDLICGNIDLQFNNGYNHPGFPAATTGAWVGSIAETALPTADDTSTVNATVYNVQVDTPILGLCSTTYGGSGGDIVAQFSNNGPGVPASFNFDGTIDNANGIPCSVVGNLFSVPEVIITEPEGDHTPGTSNPSVPSYDEIHYVIQ